MVAAVLPWAVLPVWVLRSVPPVPAPQFLRGDANGDGNLGVPDAITALLYQFVDPHPSVPCERALDVDDDGILAVADVIGLLLYTFADGSAPATPFPHCGPDPTSDTLSCVSSPTWCQP